MFKEHSYLIQQTRLVKSCLLSLIFAYLVQLLKSSRKRYKYKEV